MRDTYHHRFDNTGKEISKHFQDQRIVQHMTK